MVVAVLPRKKLARRQPGKKAKIWEKNAILKRVLYDFLAKLAAKTANNDHD
jgi:hypothetical protein